MLWRYEIQGRTETADDALELCVLEARDGQRAGFFARARPDLSLRAYELAEGESWREATVAVLRYLAAVPLPRSEPRPDIIRFRLGDEHPAYGAVPQPLDAVPSAKAWYARVADVVAFLKRVEPALQQRLRGSAIGDYSGALSLSFYRSGVRLALERGRLTGIEEWTPGDFDDGDAAFPDLTFLQLLFGYRTLEEIEGCFPDCIVRMPDARTLLHALFPASPSCAWALL